MAEFVTVAKASDLAEGELQRFDVGGTPVAVANVGGTLYAFGNTCTHEGCSLAQGELDDTTVTMSMPRLEVRRNQWSSSTWSGQGTGRELRGQGGREGNSDSGLIACKPPPVWIPATLVSGSVYWRS